MHLQEEADLKKQLRGLDPDLFYSKSAPRVATTPCLSTVTEESAQTSVGHMSNLSALSEHPINMKGMLYSVL